LFRRLLDSQWTYFTLAGVLLVILLITQFEIQFPARPKGTVEDIEKLADRKDMNVLFITIDTLRADRLHAYGSPRETSPALDYLANTGVRFAHVVSQSSWTKASMASLWTSAWPRRTGVLRWNHALPEDVEMPAEVLKKAGFRTTGIWRNGWVASSFGFGQGFDTYLRVIPTQTPVRFKRATPSASALRGTDEDLTIAAQEFLRAYPNERFFLYLHFMDVHQYAYDENSALFGTSYSDTYDNAIHWVDSNVARVLQELQKLGLWKKTLVVVTSDHGEGFREHGLEGHAKSLYGEVVYVPWIISFPFELEQGIVVDETVGNVDVWPTLYAILGIEPPYQGDGRSKLPQILGATSSDGPAPYYSDIDQLWGRPKADPQPLVGVTMGDSRLIQPLKSDWRELDESKPLSVYDRKSDPTEQKNLASEDGGPPAELREALDAYLATEPGDAPWGSTAREVELEDMELNALRALGYVVK
jgi:arylsulfatase A-like enzyme